MTEHERVERLLKSGDEALKRTEELIGCPIEVATMTSWTIQRRTDRRQIDRRNTARENSDRRAR